MGDMDEEATSLRENLWILESGKPSKESLSTLRRRIHLENFYRDQQGTYLVATKNATKNGLFVDGDRWFAGVIDADDSTAA